ncbi:apolipoprotein N-acyltransferase [Acinetobacter qingfengensis]|uniref:Apolipoprotein N-acyltransferase n=1 Tax=Acinetobacter qingfengensis TaxID=1262585 RepID=A0A1E7RA54_9GAMM|nr:apolipoprotein N-acyltransferase [Acinetobacter qingfengensis]KAA8733926.1 apolipoprotein N-acyltransferase [Acinetobacter qingfengensis]OEY96155.1 apolipoprotein N-acyltransferase [Acinetobacter qingfengensis]
MRSFFDKLKTAPATQKTHRISLGWVCFIALMAGAILPFALAPYHFWWLAILSPALLYACLHQRSSKHAFLIGWAFGCGLWFIGAFWLYTSIHIYGDTSSVLSVILIALMASIMGLFNAVQAWVYRRFFPETPLTFTPLWVIFEWLKTWLFTGFPWLFAGYAFTNYGLDEYAPLFGIFGVSFVVILIATAFTECLFGKRFWLIPIVLVILGAWGAKQLHWVSTKTEAPLSVSLIQGNIPQDLKWLTEYQAQTLSIYATLSQNEWGRDLVVWPESSIPMFQTEIQPFLDSMSTQAKIAHSAWVTGIPYWQEVKSPDKYPQYYNAIMASGMDTQGLYFKQRLVPFGEYIPLAGTLKWLLPGLQQGISSYSAGHDHQTPLMIKNHRLAAAICYEIAYPNLTRQNAKDNDFLVTISNDAWFTGTTGPWQHLQMVQMRAKENGRWIIRATNTGVTAIINAQGQIVKQLPVDTRAVLRGDLPAMTGETLYSRLGDWSILVLSLLLLLLGIGFKPAVVDTSYKQRR